MSFFSAQPAPPLGAHSGLPDEFRVIARGGDISKGETVRIDLGASDSDVTASVQFGSESNPTSNVLAATASHDGFQTTLVYLYGVAKEDIDDNTQGQVVFRGKVQALGGDSSAAGTGLTPGADSELVAITDGRRCCAVALETMANATLKWVLFNGIEGFATTHDVSS